MTYIEKKDLAIVETSNKITKLCQTSLSNFREEVAANGFINDVEEIHFFKVVKQVPLSNLIYYSEILDIELNFPPTGKKARVKFIKGKMKEIRSFFSAHPEFVAYIRQKHTHFDSQFFRRNYLHLICDRKSSYVLDPVYSTSHDRLLGKLKAFQRILIYLQRKLCGINQIYQPNDLKWTSSKVSLTELVYGLYHSKAINNGRADLKEIAKALQIAFHIELGDIYSVYHEMRGRKKNRVRFLEELTYTLANRMEIDDG
ncbi:MAG: RteC domain-containing protein [Bacteroidota bacterium]